MKRTCLIFFVIGFLPGIAVALGLGNLTLDSGLNQPFEARIELLSPTADEISSLRVQLADMEAFRRAHIERPFVLSQLRFEVEEPETGSDYIRIYSEQPIREPYLNFLVEASWSKGRLFREYTVLLDPPLYDAYAGKQAPVAAAQPGISTRAPAEKAPAPAPGQTTTYAGGFTGTEYGPVNAGETLWSIASRTRPDASISIQQMMLALLRTNPEAFINNNINGLKRGEILRMPDKGEIQSLSQVEAFREARSQNSMWEEMRAAIAETTPVRPVTAQAKQPSPAVSTQEEGAELRLVTPEGKGEGQAGTAEEAKLDKDLALATEQLETVTQENQDLKDRLSQSDGVINDLKRLVQLKDDELAALQQQVAEAETGAEAGPPEETTEEEGAAEQAPETEAGPAPEEQVKPEQQAAPPAVVSAPAPAPAGIVAKIKQIIMANLIIIAGAVVAVILIVIVLVFLARRRSGAEEVMLPEVAVPSGVDEDEIETVFDARHGEAETAAEVEIGESESITEIPEEEQEAEIPEEEAEAPTEFAAFEEETEAAPAEEPAAEAEAAPAEVEQPAEFEEEPLAEVNVFLAYEHFDQAEEFVRNAIGGDPENLDYHVKLLEVFYAAGNKTHYEEEARVLNDLVNGQGSHWDMATAMWQEMSPNRALFAEPVAGEEEKVEAEAGGMLDLTAAEDEASDTAKPEAGLDFDFGAEEEAAPSEEGVLDISTPSSDEDILDVTAAISAGGSDQDLLDVTAAVGIEPEPSEEVEVPEQAEEQDILDISAAGDEPVLDITSGPEESALDITGTAAVTPSGEDLLDVSKVSGEDLLDVTSHTELEEQDMEEDLLDVTSSTSAGADSDELLEIGEEGETEGSQESGALDFDIGGTEPDESEETAPEGDENVIEFDTGTGDQTEDVLSLDAEQEQEFEIEAEAETEEPQGLEIDLNIDEQETGSDVLDLSLDEGAGEAGAEIDLTMDEESTPEISLDDTEEVSDLEIESTEGDTGFELELETEEEGQQEPEGLDMEGTVEMPNLELVAEEESEDEDDEEHTVFVPRSMETQEQSPEDEVATKLDLAKAYVELGDKDSAKGILEEIISDGNDQQRTQAQELLKQI